MKQPADENRTSSLARPPMAAHTLAALCGAYVRYVAQRTGYSEEYILDRFYTETGGNSERDHDAFRRWAGKKVYMLDQLRVDPFGGESA